MKVKVVAVCFLSIVFFASNVFSQPIFTVYWGISSLQDDADNKITGVTLDLDFGGEFIPAHGVIDIGGGAANTHGSAYLAGDGNIYMDLSVRGYLLIFQLSVSSLGGTVQLYDPDIKLIDSGTVSFGRIVG